MFMGYFTAAINSRALLSSNKCVLLASYVSFKTPCVHVLNTPWFVPPAGQPVRSLSASPRMPLSGTAACCRWHPTRWHGSCPSSPPRRRPSPAQSAWSAASTHSPDWPAEWPSLSQRPVRTCNTNKWNERQATPKVWGGLLRQHLSVILTRSFNFMLLQS